jgi:TonB family protein
MRTWHKKEKERLLISVFIALLLHVGLFLMIEYGDFLPEGEPAEYIGPMTVEISEYTVIPEPFKEQPQAEEPVEQPPSEEQEIVDEEPMQSEQTPETTEQVREAEDQPVEQDGQKTTPAESEDQAIAESSETSSYEVPTPSPAEDEEKQKHTFNGTDEGNEFSIQMGSISDIAKPNIGPSIAEQLPQTVKGLDKSVEVIFSFILGPDGKITRLYMDKSSGYPEIDRAIRSTLLQWKFSRPIREERVEGEFTYVIKP